MSKTSVQALTAAQRVLRGLTFKDTQITNALEMIHRALQVGASHDAMEALQAYRERGNVSLNDRALEASILHQLQKLEETCDQVGPTTLRHKLSELIVQMRAEIWAFDQSASPWR